MTPPSFFFNRVIKLIFSKGIKSVVFLFVCVLFVVMYLLECLTTILRRV